MNYNPNDKIAQITSHTLIVGVDTAKLQVCRMCSRFRGIEFGSAFHFFSQKY